MARQITTLRSFNTMREAYDILMPLYSAFLKAHKRSERVEIMLASTSKAPTPVFASKSKPSPDLIEIRCHYDEMDKSDMEWFKKELNK